MAKKRIDPVISMAGNFQTFATELSAEVQSRGGTLAEAVVLLAQPGHRTARNQIADILAGVCQQNGKVPELVAPDGGRIHIVRVLVNPSRPWQNAVDSAGPNTPSNYDVRRVADKYPPQDGAVEEKEIILVNFGRTIPDTQVAVDWVKQYKLRPASPRPVFAIGECKPQLHRELGLDSMAVVSPEECTFDGGRRVCHVWWGGADRDCYLDWYDDEWDADFWFAFVRE